MGLERTTTTVRAASAAVLLAACATAAWAAPPVAPEPAKPVDAASFFTGRWYEIGRTPMSLTDGCVAGYTDYIKTGDHLTQRDACRDKTPVGKEKVIAGPLRILNPGQNTKVHVSYRFAGLIPIARDYWMLDHGDGWFIQATPDMKMVNLYTRDPRPSPALVTELTSRIRALGYSTGDLEFPPLQPPN
jgi:apolipoprotein D and lipocalin family protein